MKELIKQLVETYGPSGHEEQVRALIEGLIRSKVDEQRTDAMGNLIALKRGTGGGRRIMIAAHMDEIALVVTFIDQKGFVRVGRVGGVSPLTMIGSRVRFADGAIGVIGYEKWMQAAGKPAAWEELFVDMGAPTREQVRVRPGDMACFDRPFNDLGQRLVAKAMDDRVGCAVGVQALLELESSPHDLYFVFTTQEEVGDARRARLGLWRGARSRHRAGRDAHRRHARGAADGRLFGEGPAIKVMDHGAIAHPGVRDWMVSTAEKIGIKHQLEVLEFGGTDAEAMQSSRAGVPAGTLSVPCRYVHTPSEMVDYGDVEGCVKLLRAMLTGPVPFGE